MASAWRVGRWPPSRPPGPGAAAASGPRSPSASRPPAASGARTRRSCLPLLGLPGVIAQVRVAHLHEAFDGAAGPLPQLPVFGGQGHGRGAPLSLTGCGNLTAPFRWHIIVSITYAKETHLCPRSNPTSNACVAAAAVALSPSGINRTGASRAMAATPRTARRETHAGMPRTRARACPKRATTNGAPTGVGACTTAGGVATTGKSRSTANGTMNTATLPPNSSAGPYCPPSMSTMTTRIHSITARAICSCCPRPSTPKRIWPPRNISRSRDGAETGRRAGIAARRNGPTPRTGAAGAAARCTSAHRHSRH